MEHISQLSSSLLDLKKKKDNIQKETTLHLKNKCDLVKKKRIEEYKVMTTEINAKERELCRKTNQLVDELVDACDDTPFQKALMKVLTNLKGNKVLLL